MSARDFDHSLDSTESWSGIMKLRQKMSEQAFGNVLEVAIGTGRNFSYYDWKSLVPKTPADILRVRSRKSAHILSYTGVDISSDMLEVAEDKLHKVVPIADDVKPFVKVCYGSEAGQAAGSLQYHDGRIRIVKSDAQQFVPKPLGAETYDTVLQTFGLCSVPQPEIVLKNIASVTTPETGRIILLEHGTGSYGFVNSLLDKSAPGHFEKYGCWWNRDIEGIVRKAASEVPGLEVVKVEKPWFQLGTLYWIELKVNSHKS
ncbi:hypothetical protein TD95_005302 [Thielaviopsis punctulata]|uniref:Methyltransferase type 11 domain-containing protein n=1 Tax=Thielaviopsis punctulata TaxID=72032 RepID=A0A0F4Z9H1_9PEZI|nr:hypothetical protein TD95_005302 [Thielaviopsis punctulata]